MAQLAIQGHATRGEEVIEILEMLGGKNPYAISADAEDLSFTISDDDNYIIACYPTGKFVFFALEEFLEKYPYKVGDKVYNIVHNETQTITDLAWDFQEDEVGYQTNNNEYVYVNYLQPCKEETMENKLGQITLDIPDGYEFFGINDDNKVVLTKIQPKYPKTYEECCDVLGTYPIYNNPNLCICEWHPETRERHEYYSKLANLSQEWDVFMKLLICRDAYWKIAGDWKPDWNDNSKFKYVITCKSCNIIMYSYCTLNCILAFPTAEMRDAFYGDFKELIEECKELL
jgi:hypothetical protein